MADWQPIETAPKDGEPILVSDGKTVECASWTNGRWVANTGTTAVWEGGDRGGFTDTECWPTHWMPLPPAPTRGGVGGC